MNNFYPHYPSLFYNKCEVLLTSYSQDFHRLMWITERLFYRDILDMIRKNIEGMC